MAQEYPNQAALNWSAPHLLEVHSAPVALPNMADAYPDVEQRLGLHLTEWVGQWPPMTDGITVVGDPARLQPTWDGSIRKLLGVGNGRGTIIAVPPLHADAIAAALSDGPDRAGIGDELGAILGTGPGPRFRSTPRGNCGTLGARRRCDSDVPARTEQPFQRSRRGRGWLR